MSRIQCRGSIARAVFVVALLSSGPADAQVVVVPSPKEPMGVGNPVVTGVAYDVVNQEKAERRLEAVQAKLGRDAERGDSAAVGRDNRRINNLRFRIAVDEWLIRKNSLQDPGCYPLRIDTLSCTAIALAARPEQEFYPPQIPSNPAPIAIVNAGPAGSAITFSINGVPYQIDSGSRQTLSVTPNTNITYERGGKLGQRRYLISAGLYEFRFQSPAVGWELYRIPGMP